MPPDPAPDPAITRPDCAVVLAGGSGRRLGSVDKPALVIGGRRLLDVALAAVTPAVTIVVGPARALPSGVGQVQENPPGGGPAAALAAGMRALAERFPAVAPAVGPSRALVAVLAADLPGIDSATMARLATVVDHQRLRGAVLIDDSGRLQYLAGVWRYTELRDALAARVTWDGARLADLLAPLVDHRLPAAPEVAADIDTPGDLAAWTEPLAPG